MFFRIYFISIQIYSYLFCISIHIYIQQCFFQLCQGLHPQHPQQDLLLQAVTFGHFLPQLLYLPILGLIGVHLISPRHPPSQDVLRKVLKVMESGIYVEIAASIVIHMPYLLLGAERVLLFTHAHTHTQKHTSAEVAPLKGF